MTEYTLMTLMTPLGKFTTRRANDFFDYSKLDLKEEERRDREQRLIFPNSVVFPELQVKVRKHLQKRNEYFVTTPRMAKSDYNNGSYVILKVDEKGPTYKARYEVLPLGLKMVTIFPVREVVYV